MGDQSTPFYSYIYFTDATFAAHARKNPVSHNTATRTLHVAVQEVRE